jgi:flagellar hook capping protein
MTQMAMVQSLSTMTSNMKEEMALTKTTYLAGLIGKEVTVKLPEKENSLVENQPKEKSGVIASVNLSGKEATFRIEGDTTEYLLSDLIQIGKPGTSGATAAATSGAAASTASTGSTAVSAASSPAGLVSGVGAAASASGPSGS